MGRNEWIEIESVKFKKRRVGISLIRPSVLPTKFKKNTAKKKPSKEAPSHSDSSTKRQSSIDAATIARLSIAHQIGTLA